MKVMEGHTGGVNSVAVGGDGKRVVSGSLTTVRVWDVETGECLKVMKGHTKTVTSVAISGDGEEGGERAGRDGARDVETGSV